MMNSDRASAWQNPEQEIANLKAQLRLMAVAVVANTERAEQQQKILEMHEQRLAILEAQARGTNEQN